MEDLTMKLKKILAAIAVCAMSAAVLTMTVSAAGAEVDDATISDEEVGDDEIVADDEGEDEAPADDEDETPAPVVDETPAPNPPTGNAPIALAVIPVALAAAAVVAKKAK